MRNYQNSKIYEVINTHNDMKYLGCTTDSLSKRLNQHKRNWMRWEILSRFIESVGGWSKFRIVLIRNVPCLSSLSSFRYLLFALACL